MIELREAAVAKLQLRARLPFRYGVATMTQVPHLILRLTFAFDGKLQAGLAADNLAPKWFTKNPARSVESEIEEMLAVIRTAVSLARDIRASGVFAFWRELYSRQAAWAAQNKIPLLLAHFGTSLVERALIDAFCRGQNVTFGRALRENRFGVDLGALRFDLAGTEPRDWLPASPPAAIFVRHTVGLSDPIDDEDLRAAESVHDGLPQTLAECVRFYGLRYFKIKIDGDAARDRARIAKIAAVIANGCRGREYAFSLDGNESFREVATFVEHARALRGTGPREFWERLLFIEQPLHRKVALTAAGELAARWPDRPPIIIDESDAELGSLPAALALGYAGTSHKNCKGIFKGIANACLLAQRRAAGLPGQLSGEDLTNVGPVALLQDLAVQSALGITHVERNGHHYFAGLAQFPAAMQEYALRRHGEVFIAHHHGKASWPRVNIRDGRLELDSVLAAQFGYADGCDFPAGLECERWLA
jgi:hypothetical protein